MENFIVSARKYRPNVFSEVVGQQHVTNTLANAIAQNHLAQALLFTGPRGVGKTTCARILARMINEDDQQDSDDQEFSFNIFELDAASNNSVDDIRNLIDQVRFAPQAGNYKVYIIDEVHMLSQAAFNAFLKTLEEPPKHAIFILATTEKHKIIPTILSRCQIYDFKRITVEDISGHLRSVAQSEGIQAEDEALHIIAQKADGALRDALSIFDRIVSFAGNTITYKDVIDNLRILDYDYYFRTTDCILANDKSGLLLLFDDILDNGFDGHLYLNGLSAHFRDLLVCKDPRTLELLQVGENTRNRYKEQAQKTDMGFLLKGLKLMNECDVRYKGSNNPRLLVELCLLQTVQLLHELPEKKNTDRSHLAAPVPQVKKPESTKEVNTTAERIVPPQPIKESPPVISQPESSGTIEQNTPPISAVAEKQEPYGKLKKKRARAGISITAAMADSTKEDKKEVEDVDEDAPKPGLPSESFTENQLNNLWREYLNKLKDQQQQRIFNSLDSATIRLRDKFQVEIELHSSAQLSSFHEEKHKIMRFLREKLNNFSLVFNEKLVETKANLEPYSAQEKFDYMVKKNPHLLLLKQKLNLDLE